MRPWSTTTQSSRGAVWVYWRREGGREGGRERKGKADEGGRRKKMEDEEGKWRMREGEEGDGQCYVFSE